MGTVVRLFETRDQARRAVEALRDAGFRTEDLGIAMRDRQEAADVAADVGAGGATAAGAAGGGVLGALAGLFAGAGALAIPGIGPIVAAGPLLAALGGGAIGALAGGLIGALVDMGVPEEEARDYQAGVERGGILLTARVPDGREAEARAALDRAGVRDLDYHRGLWTREPNYRYDIDRTADVGTGAGEATAGGAVTGGLTGAVVGGVAGGPAGAAAGALIGGVAGAGVGAAIDFTEVEPEFRREWETGPDRGRSTWEQAAPAYRYGWESYDRPEYRGRAWDEVRPELERGWREPAAWSQYEPMIRRGWERRTSDRVGR
jgi:Heat induced stress protein YflT